MYWPALTGLIGWCLVWYAKEKIVKFFDATVSFFDADFYEDVNSVQKMR